jgi:hypothetical protein
MSLSGDSRTEFCPEGIDLLCQLSHVSGVVHDHISGERAIVATGLSGNPGLGFGTGEPVACHQPLDLGFMIGIHRDDKIEVLALASLDQQWDHVNDNCSIARSPFELGGPRSNGGVHNSLEIATRDRVREDNFGKPCPVESTVFEHPHTKTVEDRGKRRSAWFNYLTGQYVGVDDHRTACGKPRGHHALPGRDAARQAYPHHGQQPMRARGGLRQAARFADCRS